MTRVLLERVVESVGEKVTEVKEGDMVIPVFISNCQECRDCKSKKSNICTKVPFRFLPGMARDGRSVFKDSTGEIISNFLSISSFSEYTVVDVSQLVRIDAGFPPEKACLLSCGVTTGIYKYIINTAILHVVFYLDFIPLGCVVPSQNLIQTNARLLNFPSKSS